MSKISTSSLKKGKKKTKQNYFQCSTFAFPTLDSHDTRKCFSVIAFAVVVLHLRRLDSGREGPPGNRASVAVWVSPVQHTAALFFSLVPVVHATHIISYITTNLLCIIHPVLICPESEFEIGIGIGDIIPATALYGCAGGAERGVPLHRAAKQHTAVIIS